MMLSAPGVSSVQTRRMQDMLLKSAFERRSGYFQDMAQISGVAGREDVNKLMSSLQDLTMDKMKLVGTNSSRSLGFYTSNGASRKQRTSHEAKRRSVESAYEDICGELRGLVASSQRMTNMRV